MDEITLSLMQEFIAGNRKEFCVPQEDFDEVLSYIEQHGIEVYSYLDANEVVIEKINTRREKRMSVVVDPKRVVTGRVRLSYVHLTTPRAREQGGKLQYGVTLLIPKFDVATRQRIDQAINAAILEGVSSKWNGVRPTQPAVPIYDGDGVRPSGEAFSEECKGHWVITASSDQKPQVVDLNLNEIINATEIYSGMYGRVSVRFFPYFSSGKKGVGCGLNNVQKLEDGEPLGGRTSAADDFGGGAGGYAPPAPAYQQQPVYPQQPVHGQQPVYPQSGAPASPGPVQPVQIDPITGLPVTGGVMGI